MLKKIKDLNKEELDKICNKYKCCSPCPLQTDNCNCVYYYVLDKKWYDKKVKEEIEVEENE